VTAAFAIVSLFFTHVPQLLPIEEQEEKEGGERESEDLALQKMTA